MEKLAKTAKHSNLVRPASTSPGQDQRRLRKGLYRHGWGWVLALGHCSCRTADLRACRNRTCAWIGDESNPRSSRVTKCRQCLTFLCRVRVDRATSSRSGDLQYERPGALGSRFATLRRTRPRGRRSICRRSTQTPFPTIAVSQDPTALTHAPGGDRTYLVDTTFPRGRQVASWLFNVSASTAQGSIDLVNVKARPRQ
jgi:hypothetical protein